MSTVPGYPDATSPTPETGLLWLTEGSGSTRDKKVQAGTLVTDLLGRAVNSQAAAASPIVPATDLLPVVRGNTGGKASVGAVVAAGLPTAIEGLTTAATLDGTEYVPLRTATDTVKRALVSALVQHAVADKTATTLVKFDDGSNSLLSVDGSANDSIQIMADISYRFTHVHASLNLAGHAASATNNNPAEIVIDLNGEFPSASFASLGIRGTAHASVGTSPLYKTYGVVAVRDPTTPPALYYRLQIVNMSTGAVVNWADLCPTNGTGVSLEIDIVGTKIP